MSDQEPTQIEEENLLDSVAELALKERQRIRSQLKTDTGRIIFGSILMCLFFFPWYHTHGLDGLQELMDNLRIVSYVSGFGVATALITHFTRRILFPYIDIKELAVKAVEDAKGAGLVFLGIAIILASTIWAAAGFFK